MTIYDTVIVPYLTAELVVKNYMQENKIGMSIEKFNSLVNSLEQKAEIVFEKNILWQKQLLKAKDERVFLYGFMQHWLLAEIQKQKEPLLQIEMFHNINSQLDLFA